MGTLTRGLLLALATFALSGCHALAQVSGPGSVIARAMQYEGRDYPFAVYVPLSYRVGTPTPAILLIHGAGGNGPDFLETWRATAESKGIILIAPTLDLSAEAETRVPAVLPRIVDVVSTEWTIDPKRRYVFGYSAGGYFAFDAMLLRADYFAGGGVFASIIAPDYEGIVAQAPRTTSIAIYLGDRDPYFTETQGRRTRDILLAAKMDVRYVEIPNQDHGYAAVAAGVNEDAWSFIGSRRLP